MKQQDDTKTADMFGDVKKAGRPRKHKSNAAKQAAYRSRKNVSVLSVAIPKDLAARLDEFASRAASDKGVTKQEIIERLLERQLLRKR